MTDPRTPARGYTIRIGGGGPGQPGQARTNGPRPLAIIGALLIFLAIAEVLVFVQVGQAIGYGWTLLILFAISAVGLQLVRHQGVRGWRNFQAEANAGRPPGRAGTNGLVGLVGAILIMVPGFITDVIGLLLLIPPGRPLASRWLQRYTARHMRPDVATDVFGPRKVRVRTGSPQRPDPAKPAPERGDEPPPTVEGEIIG
jgi:UPF0716 protein FxsA